MSGLRPSTPNNEGSSDDPPRSPNNNNISAPFLSNQPSSANSAATQGGGGLLSTSPSHRASVIGSSNNGYHLGHPTLQHPYQSPSTRASNASHQRPSTRGSAAVKGKFVLLRNNATGGSGITSPVGSTRNIHGGGGGRAEGSDVSSRRGGGGALPLPPNPSHPHFGRANSIQREDYAAANSRPTSGSEEDEDDDEEEEEDDEEEEEFDRNAFRQVASEINVNVNALIKKLQAAESGGHKETMLRAKLKQNTRGGGATEARVVDVAYLASPSASSRPYGSNTPSPVGSGKFTGAAGAALVVRLMWRLHLLLQLEVPQTIEIMELKEMAMVKAPMTYTAVMVEISRRKMKKNTTRRTAIILGMMMAKIKIAARVMTCHKIISTPTTT